VLEHRGADGSQDTQAGQDGTTVTLPNGRVIQPTDHFCDGWDPDQGKVVDDPGAQCMGEESHLQSWVFGDEGKLNRTVGGKAVTDSDLMIPKAYKGDRVTYHVVHPGAKETHPFHQHTQRWFADPGKANSPRDDVQSIGPGEAREFTLEKGAGGVQQTIGDSIFHCHLYPHFAQGFWGHLRIFDRQRRVTADGAAKLADGTLVNQRYADGTPLEALRELGDRVGQTPKPVDANPGFPLFVKGEFGQRAYRPPYAVVKDDFAPIRRKGDAPRGPTQLEKANLPALSPTKPGAGYIDPCPATATLRTYRPHAVDGPIKYNSANWSDPEGRFYVEEAHLVGGRVDRNKNPSPTPSGPGSASACRS
jgi:manganese oxidase